MTYILVSWRTVELGLQWLTGNNYTITAADRALFQVAMEAFKVGQSKKLLGDAHL